MTLHRPLKEGEKILVTDFMFYDDKIGPVWARFVGETFKRGRQWQPFRPVKVPTFEEVETTISEICDSRSIEGCKNITCEECSYKATLKRMGFTGG